MESLIQNLIWCGLGIITTVVLYCVFKRTHKRIIEDLLMDITTNSYIDKVNAHNRIFTNLRTICISVWVVIINLMVLFFSYSGQEGKTDMGSSITNKEIIKVVPLTKEEVGILNENILEEKESKRNKKIEEERMKSRNDFSDFLNNNN